MIRKRDISKQGMAKSAALAWLCVLLATSCVAQVPESEGPDDGGSSFQIGPTYTVWHDEQARLGFEISAITFLSNKLIFGLGFGVTHRRSTLPYIPVSIGYQIPSKWVRLMLTAAPTSREDLGFGVLYISELVLNPQLSKPKRSMTVGFGLVHDVAPSAATVRDPFSSSRSPSPKTQVGLRLRLALAIGKGPYSS